jgi:SdpC family antimicrobial peptide
MVLLRKRFATLVTALALIPVGSGTSGAETSKSPAFSDRDLVQAVILGVGPAASRLGTYALPARLQQDPRVLRSALEFTNALERGQPGMIHQLAATIREGNPLAVDAALNNAFARLQVVRQETGRATGKCDALVAAIHYVTESMTANMLVYPVIVDNNIVMIVASSMASDVMTQGQHSLLRDQFVGTVIREFASH